MSYPRPSSLELCSGFTNHFGNDFAMMISIVVPLNLVTDAVNGNSPEGLTSGNSASTLYPV